MGAFIGGFFAIFILFALIIVGGIVFLIVYMVKQGEAPTNKNEETNERNEVIATAKEGVSELAPWMNRKASDLGTSMRYSYFKGFKGTLKGKIYSQDEDKVLSFYRIQRGLTPYGLIAASSTDFDLFYIFDQVKTIMYYNKKSIAAWLPSGKIINSQNQEIGRAVREEGFEFQIGSIYEHRSGPNHYTVTLNGRELATILISRRVSDFGDSLFSNIADYGRVIHYKAAPSEEEEKILLMFAVYELAYHGFSFVDV